MINPDLREVLHQNEVGPCERGEHAIAPWDRGPYWSCRYCGEALDPTDEKEVIRLMNVRR